MGLGVISGDADDVSVGPTVDFGVSDGATNLDGYLVALRFQPSVNVDADVRLRQVFAVEPAAGYAVGHIAAELAVGGAGIDVRSARPITKGIDLGSGVSFADVFSFGVALANDEPVAVQDVFAVCRVNAEKEMGDFGQLALLVGYGHTTENSVIAAADVLCLVACEDAVLRRFLVVHHNVIAGNSVHGVLNIGGADGCGRLGNDMADAVPDEHLNGDLRAALLFVCHVHNGTGNSVGYFVRVFRVDFFKHFLLPPCVFLALCGMLWC